MPWLNRCPCWSLCIMFLFNCKKPAFSNRQNISFILLCKINIHESASSRPWEVRLTYETEIFNGCFLVRVGGGSLETSCFLLQMCTHKCFLSGEDLDKLWETVLQKSTVIMVEVPSVSSGKCFEMKVVWEEIICFPIILSATLCAYPLFCILCV